MNVKYNFSLALHDDEEIQLTIKSLLRKLDMNAKILVAGTCARVLQRSS